MLLDVHFILVLLGYLMTGVLALLWWRLYRKSVTRSEECLRCIEEELNTFRLEINRRTRDLRGRLGLVEGKIDIIRRQVQEHTTELESILPRLAVLERDSGRS